MACTGFQKRRRVSRSGVVRWFCVEGGIKKIFLMALLHDWAFVTAKVLAVTSARGTLLSNTKLIINYKH